MHYFPKADAFTAAYQAGKAQLVYRTFLSDLETPVSAMLKLQDSSDYHILFESVIGGERKGRYSIIALDPDRLWECKDGTAYISELKGESFTTQQDGDDIFASLRRFIRDATENFAEHDLPPMAAGAFGYMGYDMVKHMEKLPHANPDRIGISDALYIRPRTILIFDAVKDEALIISPVYPDTSLSAENAYKQACFRIDAVIETLNTPVKRSIYDRFYASEDPVALSFTSHIEQKEYHAIVEKAKAYIRAGDVFQVVPSRRQSAPFTEHPFALYRSLRHLNPSPYLFYAHMKDFAIIGSSPEILVKVSEGKVTIRPIAGTRKRGKTEAEDRKLEQDLLNDNKELSEHLMLLDLGRNDVGRVAKPNTVTVTEQNTIERYSHVMHIVSNVEGELADDKDALDALIAGFPAGTVSGAPKIRAMEIIDELEPEAREFYAGTVGYFGLRGEMDTCIALRTGLVKDNTLYIQAGGGVVADSDPEAEFMETENKAGALKAAANRAHKFS